MDKKEKSKKSKLLQERNDHIDKVLQHHKKVEKIIPEIQKIREITELQKNIIDDIPEEYEDQLPDVESPDIETENLHLKTILPIPSDFNINNIHNFTAISTSATSSYQQIILNVRAINTDKAKNYYMHYHNLYQGIQENQDRAEDVRTLISKLNDQACIERYERSYEAYYALKSETGTRTNVAGEIRTLLDGIKGALIKKARRSDREDINWSQMSDRLAKNGEQSVECQSLKNQESVRSELYNDLSTILKDREGSNIRDLDDIWIESLDHIYTVLSLTNI